MTARAAGIILVAALLSVPVPAVDGASREHHQTDSLRGQEASVDRRFGSVPAADSSPVPSPAPTPLTRAVETRAPSVDFCACGSGSVIDLSRSAFDRLGDPRRGVMRVRVEVMG